MTTPRKPRRRQARPRPGASPDPSGATAAPEKPRRFAQQDEPFWRQQEARLAGLLGQPCCTLSGMCTLLGRMDGDFAVIIHGERDCGNSFVHHQMVSAERFFGTCLSEDELTAGRVDGPLERCLRLVLEELAPEVVLVLGTCPVTMIGADPGPVVDRVAAETDVPIRLLRTSGLQLSTQAEMMDWLYASLAGLPQRPQDQAGWRPRLASALQEIGVALLGDEQLQPADVMARVEGALARPPRERCVNLIGLPADGVLHSELVDTLAAADIYVTGLYPFHADLHGWRSISQAAVNVVADRRLYPRLLAHLEQEHAQPTVEVPLPIGLSQSLRFYRAIGEFFDAREPLEEALDAPVAAARDQVASFRARAAGTRVAVGIRMLNNYEADQLAYDGLGDVEALAELGFDLTLLVQGPPEQRARFDELLAGLGVTLPVQVFPNPWELAGRLREGGYQVAYLADHSREEAAKAGVPMIPSRALAPLLAGVAPNLDALAALLRAADPARGTGR